MFYGFLLSMWMMKRLDEAKIRTYVPKFITADEALMIIATPQHEDYQAEVTKEEM